MTDFGRRTQLRNFNPSPDTARRRLTTTARELDVPSIGRRKTMMALLGYSGIVLAAGAVALLLCTDNPVELFNRLLE
jgi:hypothetical protein